MKYLSKQELIHAARLAAQDIDNANTRQELVAVFKKHIPALGYKTLAKLLVGQDPEAAVKKWAEKIDEGEFPL